MELDKELIDKLLAGYKGPEELIGEQGLLKQLTKALVERALNAELTHHLGYEKHDPEGRLISGALPALTTRSCRCTHGA
jgi:transposase-like protein